jgi:hypothetical protein
VNGLAEIETASNALDRPVPGVTPAAVAIVAARLSRRVATV